MKDINQIAENEKLYKEYITLYHSRGCRFRRNMHRMLQTTGNDRCRLIKKKIDSKIGDYYIRKYLKGIEDYVPYYCVGEPIEGVKVAVYACITGGYDVVKQPVYIGADTEYTVFIDKFSNKSGTWIEKKIREDVKIELANRYYKFHPFEEFEGYDYAIYTDGNVRVLSDVTTVCSIAAKAKTGIAMHRHHERKCIYEEAYACKYYKRGNQLKIAEQMDSYREEGFPQEYGMCEATVIVYDLKNSIAKDVATKWWEEYLNSGSGRDQLAFPYVLWKNGYSLDDVGDLGNDLMGNPKFLITGHS